MIGFGSLGADVMVPGLEIGSAAAVAASAGTVMDSC